ncbi:MAG: hypothetical protein WC846_04225 [Candidatus Gracilibacteria bacterium]|jgi:hypothetical protein
MSDLDEVLKKYPPKVRVFVQGGMNLIRSCDENCDGGCGSKCVVASARGKLTSTFSLVLGQNVGEDLPVLVGSLRREASSCGSEVGKILGVVAASVERLSGFQGMIVDEPSNCDL